MALVQSPTRNAQRALLNNIAEAVPDIAPMILPHSPTRNTQRTLLINSAQSVPECSDVYISTLEALQHFVELVSINPNIGRIVQDFIIKLPSGDAYPAQAVRTALRLIPKVQCLVIELPAGSPTTLLNGLQYPDLRIFSTNLPHRGLVSFLVAHPLLGSVILGSCGRSEACPLRGVELRSLTGLQCPSRCFAGIVQRSLVTATVALSRLNSMSSLAIQTITSRLHSLTIDYFTNDYDILARIATTLPHIRKLKLNEKRYPEVVSYSDHPRELECGVTGSRGREDAVVRGREDVGARGREDATALGH
ncbi:hypothetical protein TRAPUB_1399 [Trametes pubescens]|uniref:F-box domain-containing protein n=1 Tax=Trametes pubescens TaxID=154538 RepID=A0A1M2VJE0_TRAPU|nr:hypothetical protein TRAPUB_1399 [Trametes pubescens]